MYTCFGCGHLDMSRKKQNGVCYNYGCNASSRTGYTVGWCRKDSELKQQGCSSWIEKSKVPEQVSLFDL